MWKYVKKLEYPVNVRSKDLKMAKNLLSQYGGPDGEFAAAMRYLNQRYSMPDERGKALLTDIATEEMAHVEMIAAMVMQLMEGATKEELDAAGLTANYVLHDHSLFPTDPNGVPFTAAYTETTGDFIADLESDMAAEQRARAVYEHLMSLTNEHDLLGPLSFLRQREVVHFNRFKELKEYYEEKYKKKIG
jgi:spore coat protein JC